MRYGPLVLAALLATAPHALAQAAAGRAGSYTAGARSTASTNATFLSVVGQRPSRVQIDLGRNGQTFQVRPDGRVIGPDHQFVSPGCIAAPQAHPTPSAANTTTHTRLRPAPGETPPAGDAVLIGTSKTPSPMVLMNASDGPSGVYVRKPACNGEPDTPISAARAIAAMGGNPFALAGNRQGLLDATRAERDGDSVILSAP